MPEPFFPLGKLDHLVDALGEPDRADLQPVRSERVRLGDDVEPEIGWIDPEFLGDLVELHFLAEARLRRAMAALGTAWRLVREDSRGIELVARHLVGHRLQRT